MTVVSRRAVGSEFERNLLNGTAEAKDSKKNSSLKWENDFYFQRQFVH